MQLPDALVEERLQARVGEGHAEVNLARAVHPVGGLARALVEHFSVARVPLERLGLGPRREGEPEPEQGEQGLERALGPLIHRGPPSLTSSSDSVCSLVFQKVIPPACRPTSAVATRSSRSRSITSTVPASDPTPSFETKA